MSHRPCTGTRFRKQELWGAKAEHSEELLLVLPKVCWLCAFCIFSNSLNIQGVLDLQRVDPRKCSRTSSGQLGIKVSAEPRTFKTLFKKQTCWLPWNAKVSSRVLD